MPNIAIAETRVTVREPRKSACDIRDANLTGFDVRVLRSGAECIVPCIGPNLVQFRMNTAPFSTMTG